MLRYLKPAIFLACLAPLGWLVWRGFHSALGANPIETITHNTGDCTLTFLLITLSITPLRKLTRQYWLIGLRRMLGLFAFFYGTLHLMTYVLARQIFRRPRNARRHRQAPLHHRRHDRLRPDDPPGPDLHQVVDPAS